MNEEELFEKYERIVNSTEELRQQLITLLLEKWPKEQEYACYDSAGAPYGCFKYYYPNGEVGGGGSPYDNRRFDDIRELPLPNLMFLYMNAFLNKQWNFIGPEFDWGCR